MRRSLLVVAAALAACSAPEHQNPFDPSTPASEQARATLAGSVQLESVNGIPPALDDVRITVTGPRATLVAYTDPSGVWTASDVPVGAYTITAAKAGYRSTFLTGVQVTLDEGGTVVPTPPLALMAGRGQVSGTVRLLLPDLSEESTGGAAVSLAGLPGTVATGRAGGYLMTGVPAGVYTLDASKYGYQSNSVPFVSVSDMGIADAGTLPLSTDPGFLEGFVTRNDGGDVRLALVRARGFTLGGTPWESQGHPASDGSYLLSNLPAGNYQVTFELTDFGTDTTAAAIAPAEPTYLPTVAMLRDTGSIVGVARLASATDHSGIAVTLTPKPTAQNPSPTPLASAVTDATGAWRADLLPVGDYTIDYARTPGYVPQNDVPATIVKATTNAGLVTLALDVSGGLQGTVVLWDNVAGAGANPSSLGAQVSVAGTTFTGLVWTPAPFVTPASGAWSFGGLPPGTYDVVVSSAGRTCASASTLVVSSGATADAGSFRCTDALPPAAVGLGQPLPTGGGISGWVSGTSVTIPIAQAATDPTAPAANLRGYQVSVGPAPSWDTAALVPVAPAPPAQLVAGGLATNATNAVWVRAIDWVGNAGPASSVAVMQDSTDPVAPTITAPRVLADQTATVVFTGADADPSFLRYEACTTPVATTASCGGSPTCAFAPVPQSWPVALAANQRTCLWAQTVDKAGRISAPVGTSIVNDSASPAPPIFRPGYDPAAVSVRAEWVDFWLATAPSDTAWGGAGWKGIAWIEVDTGSGFQALCPDGTCHTNDTYNPCATGCACSDTRLRCDGTTFTGLRIPLASESVNSIAVRSVDLAGNAGNGLAQDVPTDTIADVLAATNQAEYFSSVFGNVVTWTANNPVGNTSSQVILDLGSNRRADPTDTTCSIANGRLGVLASRTLLAYTSGGGLVLRRAAPGAALCGADTTTSLAGPAPYGYIGASGERVAWGEGSYGPGFQFKVREPGPNGTLGDPDDVTTTFPGTYSAFWSMQLAGNQLLAATAAAFMAPGSQWRVWSGPTGFASGVTTWDVPIDANTPAALAPDGNTLAYVQGGRVVVQFPTSGRYGATDVKVSRALPAGFSSGDAIAVEGNHVVLADQTGGAFLHWNAGPDGIFDTSDDLYVQVRPSKAKRDYLGISGGLLVYGENSDVFSLDLTTVRWDDVPAGYGTTGATVANAGGTVFFGGYNPFGGQYPPLTAHCGSGRDTTNYSYPVGFDASGDSLVAGVQYSGVWLHTRDTGGSGCFFTGTSASRLLFGSANDATYGPAANVPAVLGETVLLANWPWYVPDTRVFALEPHVAGSTLAASGADPVLISTNIQAPYGVGLTAKQAVYFCGRNGGGYQVCVKGKGAGNLFRGAGAPAEQVLKHPTDAAIVADRGATLAGQHVKTSGNRLVVNTYTSGTVIVDAGVDGLFNTPDDHEITLVPYRLDGADYAISGGWIAYVDAGAPAGDQIWLYNAADRSVRQLTQHVSSKTNVSVDATGRVWWEDSVFGNTWALWTRSP